MKKLKQAGMFVVVGGAQASFLPKVTLERTGADAVVVGEAERTFLELVEAVEAGRGPEGVPGVMTGRTRRFVARKTIGRLDSLPFPDWEQMDPRKYKKAPHGGFIKSFPYAPITTTRGCPYRCKFCASPHFWKTFRARSPENVVDEIEVLATMFGVKEIHFEDDNLTFFRKHIAGICEGIIRRGLKVSMFTPNGIRADKVNLPLLKLMKRAGFYGVAFGMESGDQKILDNVRKDVKIRTLERAVGMAKEAGLMTQGFFIFGLPGETKETIDKTIDFACSLPLDRAQFNVLDVMPGTELWNDLGYDAKTYPWDARSFHEVTWKSPGLSRKDLQDALPRAFWRFYSSPRRFLSAARFMRPEQLPYLFKRFLDFRMVPSPAAKKG